MIISASRRTDVPAWHSEWLIASIRAQFALASNPFFPAQTYRVDLSPNAVDGIVFWTKNPRQLLKYLDEISARGYDFYFQLTINAYDNDCEKNLPPLTERLATAAELAQKIGKAKIIWRYDPIILTAFYPESFHYDRFSFLAEQLRTVTGKCVFSFVDVAAYPHLRRCGISELATEQQEKIAAQLAEIARRNNLLLAACAENLPAFNGAKYGIIANRCIDTDLLQRLTGRQITVKKAKSQRLNCGCAESRDIGNYNTCAHKCVYCYAARPTKKPYELCEKSG